MKFIPAIDLKNNKCVRLEKGNKENITVFNENPVAQAKYFEKNGCERIHIVDIDGAFGNPDINKATICNIRKNTNIAIELGGGIKNEDDISFWINKGVDFLVIGSLAVKHKEFVADTIFKYENKIYIALDILDKKIMIKGWVENSNLNAEDIINYYNNLSVRGFILTDISRDGMLCGLDFDLINNIILKTKKNIIVGGGLSNYDDLHNLVKIKNKNLEGVIAGKSFYSGAIKIEKSLEIINSYA